MRFDKGVIDLQNAYNTGKTDYNFKKCYDFR